MPAWMPDAVQAPAYRDAGLRQARRVLWIASELDEDYSPALAARYCNATLRSVHLIWDPSTGEVVQMLPADKRATWLPHDGVQVLVLNALKTMQGKESQTLSGLEGVLVWVRSLDVPDFWPQGPSTPFESSAPGADGHYVFGAINDRAIRRAVAA